LINKKVVSVVLNNFKNDSRVLKENISLQNAGYDVQVVALWEDGVQEKEEIANIPVHRVKLKSKNWSKNKLMQLIKYFEFLYKVSKEYKSADILHCNDLNTLPIGFVVKRFYNKEVKIVYDAHEYEINDKPNESRYSIKIKYFIEKFLIRYADRVITVSEAIADEYKKMYPFIKKPALVLNTPQYKEIAKKDIFRETFDIPKDTTIFLYQGGLSKGRGIEILLETFKQLSTTQTTDNRYTNIPVIVFMGYGELEELIKQTSKEYENIYFHKAVTPDILLDYTSSADFGILFYENNCLNHDYCSPNKMFEYLMAEIPVIVSNLYEMKRLVEDNNIGVVAKKNTPKGLKEAIKEAVKLDKEKLKTNIKNVKTIYNWENQEKVLLEVYKELK
jgi:glycosyltransferase involved in cell wall biosynthesis